MRIVSLLPSATEIVCVLGAGRHLVGRSHECDYPPEVTTVPVLTRARIEPPSSSRAIDAAVRHALEDALAIYQIDQEGLERARPDVIVTQDLCDVCAVSLDDVRSAVSRLADRPVHVVSLRPMTLGDIWGDVSRVAEAIGAAETGRQVRADLEQRVSTLAARAAALSTRPRVLTIEWLEPVMIGGMWMPELVTLAGGTPLVTAPGQHAPTLSPDELDALDPDVVLVKPCGFDLQRTRAELEVLSRVLPRRWRSRIYAADGSAYFNRPGPRIVESLEILAGCVHPELDDGKHQAGVMRIA